jgi:hypothetical protein
MKIIPSLAVIFLILSTSIGAQQSSLIDIKGSVVDEETGASLENVNVFLANTSIGTTTEKNGTFNIENTPFGTYDIIFSHIGYKTEKRSILSYKQGNYNFNISLKPQAINLNQINVTGTIPEDWKENLKLFIKYFIGKTENSEKTKILNPEVLNFVKDEKTNIFKA